MAIELHDSFAVHPGEWLGTESAAENFTLALPADLAESAPLRGHFKTPVCVQANLVSNVGPKGNNSGGLAIERLFLQRRREKEAYKSGAYKKLTRRSLLGDPLVCG
nr:hypothetical protein [Sphingosinicella humi]